ncbi:hypothetical protein JCM1841_005998 [Sporobolomyces salmonicolor]
MAPVLSQAVELTAARSNNLAASATQPLRLPFLRPAMQPEPEYISDSEPERVVLFESTAQRIRNPRRRTSDERPGLSYLREDVQVVGLTEAKPAEVLVLSSASEGEAEDEQIHVSKYFNPPTSPSKRRRVPAITGSAGASSMSWRSTSGRIGSRSPPALPRSLSESPAFPPNDQPQSLPPPPVASTSKHAYPLSYSSLDSATSLSSTKRPPRSRTNSSPSISALDLLRSGTVQDAPSYNDDDLALEYKPINKANATTTKGKGKLRQSPSFSSVEIVGGPPDLDPNLDLEDDRMSVSSGGSGFLPPPESWVSRFSYGTSKQVLTAKLSATVQAKAKAKAMESESEAESSQSRRKKPWEAFEAKASTKTKRKAAPKPKKMESDDDEVEVFTASERSRCKIGGYDSGTADPQASLYGPSSALKPLPTARSSSSFSKKLPSSTPLESTLFGAPPPIELPPNERIRVLTSCPLCASAATSSSTSKTAPLTTWSSYKSLAQRQTHLRACAAKHDYTAPTVSLLISRQILSHASEAEARRSSFEASMTLFDRAIGKGEGAGVGSWRDVRVVGVESVVAQEGGAEWHRAVKGVQEELDQERKKKGADKVVKVAKQVRREMARLEKDEEERVKTEREQEQDEAQEGMPMPRPTGHLMPETATARNVIAQRANELLGLASGTGLTQVNEEDDDEPVILSDCDASSFVNSLLPPPPTQSFAPSTLAIRLEQDGAVDVIRSGAASLGGNGESMGKERSRSPLAELELDWSSDEDEIGRRPPSSLWKAATGKDDKMIERVVRSSAPFDSSPPSSPSTASPTSALPFSALTLASPSRSYRSTIGVSSRHLHTSPLRRHRRSSEPAEPAEQLIDKLRTLGLEGQGSESPKRAGERERWVDGEWEGLVLEGGVGDGWTGGGGEKSSAEEPLARTTSRTRVKKTTVRRTRTTKDDVSASTAATELTTTRTTTRTRRTAPLPSSSSDSDLLPLSTSAAKPTSVRRRRAVSPSSPLSSDSDLPAPPVKSKSKSKSVSTPPPSAPPSPASDPDPPGMPAYADLSLSALRKEVAKYGFRPSTEKGVMVEQMRMIWMAMNPQPESVEGREKGEREEGKARGRKKATVATKTATKASTKKATKTATKGRKRKAVTSADEGEDAEEGDQQTTGERLRALILADSALYLRILRYEPIHIDEFVALTTENGLKVARALLIRCLDDQSITFYSQDPTSGRRARH